MRVDKSEKKEPLPEKLRALGKSAIARHQRRPAVAGLEVYAEDQGWSIRSPYAEADDHLWEALLFEAFGTRLSTVVEAFVGHLGALCATKWDESTKVWMPIEDELLASIQIVRSTRPRNEAEACLAAQMVAVHLLQIKLSAQALRQSWPDARTCAVAGKLARTYAMLIETMAKLKGKGGRQHITVRKFAQHEHKHIHLHPEGLTNGVRPYEPKRSRQIDQAPVTQLTSSASLSGSNQERNFVQVSGFERSSKVSTARGS